MSTRLMTAGEVAEWLGHADGKTTEIYAHYAPDPTNGSQFAERRSVAPLEDSQDDLADYPRGPR